MSLLSQYMILRGISEDALVLILMLPIIATVIAFARQVVGIKGFGIYTPLIIAFAFWAIGIIYGLVVFLVIILIGSLMRFLVKKIRLLYLPRMAIVIIGVTIAILLLIFIATYFGQVHLMDSMLSVFAVLVMITLVEKFVAAQIERGTRDAVFLTAETLILSLASFLLISWSWLQGFVLAYALWIIIGSLIINIFIGRWTGLRLSEYYRFREVIRHVELPKKK